MRRKPTSQKDLSSISRPLLAEIQNSWGKKKNGTTNYYPSKLIKALQTSWFLVLVLQTSLGEK